MKLMTIYALACAVLFTGLLATPTAQQPNGTPPAPAGVAPADFEEQALALRKQLLQTRKDAAIQPQMIAIREQLMKQIESSPEVQAETKAIAEAEQRLGDRKVKEAGKDIAKFRWDGKEVVPIAATPIAEKK